MNGVRADYRQGRGEKGGGELLEYIMHVRVIGEAGAVTEAAMGGRR